MFRYIHLLLGQQQQLYFDQFPRHRTYFDQFPRQVLCPLLISPKGFMPSVLKLNLMFLASKAKSVYVLSIFLHYDPSAQCLNIESCLRVLLWYTAWWVLMSDGRCQGLVGQFGLVCGPSFVCVTPDAISCDFVYVFVVFSPYSGLVLLKS